ncbi:MAG: hypothetical protein N2050_00340 [Flavobacteriales bacterium]|nr:hypothetical protein [Flavobacteriales bacterium]
MMCIWPKWNPANLKLFVIWALCAGLAVCRPAIEKGGGGLRWRLWKAGSGASPCKDGFRFQIHVWVWNEENSLATDTLLWCDSPDAAPGADFRLCLRGRAPGDSLELQIPVDSLTFLDYYLAPFARKGWVSATIKILDCQDAALIWEAEENRREQRRFEAYKAFDSTIRRLEPHIFMAGKGAGVVRIVKGRGRRLRFGDKVRLHAVFYAFSGASLLSTPDSGAVLEVYDGSWVPGLHEALACLHSCDSAVVYLPYFLAFGEEGYPPKVGEFENILIRLKVQLLQKN